MFLLVAVGVAGKVGARDPRRYAGLASFRSVSELFELELLESFPASLNPLPEVLDESDIPRSAEPLLFSEAVGEMTECRSCANLTEVGTLCRRMPPASLLLPAFEAVDEDMEEERA